MFGFHTFGDPERKVELAWEVGRSQWNDAATGIGVNVPNTPYGVSLGEASSLPALEARVTVSRGSALSAFVAGHWNRVDLTGAGTDGADGVADRLDVLAGNVGAKGTFGPLSLAASGYYGKNTGPVLGNLVQFQSGGAVGTPGAPGATPGLFSPARAACPRREAGSSAARSLADLHGANGRTPPRSRWRGDRDVAWRPVRAADGPPTSGSSDCRTMAP